MGDLVLAWLSCPSHVAIERDLMRVDCWSTAARRDRRRSQDPRHRTRSTYDDAHTRDTRDETPPMRTGRFSAAKLTGRKRKVGDHSRRSPDHRHRPVPVEIKNLHRSLLISSSARSRARIRTPRAHAASPLLLWGGASRWGEAPLSWPISLWRPSHSVGSGSSPPRLARAPASAVLVLYSSTR